MGIVRAFKGAISSTLADQWLEVFTAPEFNEQTILAPGVLVNRGKNANNSQGVISNGSKIFVPEQSIAVFYDGGAIESVIDEPGGYEYIEGEESIFDGASLSDVVDRISDRVRYGGQSPEIKRVAFLSLKEVRNIGFGTTTPLLFNDRYYGVDLSVRMYGTYSIRITDPLKLLTNFIPTGTYYYSFDDSRAKEQMTGELLQSLSTAMSTLSGKYRLSEIPSLAETIKKTVMLDECNAGSWEDRFGFRIENIAIMGIRPTEASQKVIDKYNDLKMSAVAYEDVSRKSADIAAQQKIASGLEEHGVGDAGGAILGMNVVQGEILGASGAYTAGKTMTLDEQFEALKKLKELLDAEILTKDEFERKKKEILGN